MADLSITFKNLTVKGIDYLSINDISIDHKVNDHGYAMVNVTMEKDKASSFIERIKEPLCLEIVTSAADQKRKSLFYGFVEKAEAIESMNDGSGTVVVIHLASLSKRLDIVKRSKTFQNDGKTYKDIMQAVCDAEKSTTQLTTEVKVEGTDSTIKALKFYQDIEVKGDESWVIQYHQTAWEFILQMASRLGLCVFTDVTHDNGDDFVKISVGAPSGGKSLKDEVWAWSNIGELNQNGYGAAVEFDTMLYGCLGDKESVSFMEEKSSVGSGSYVITGVSTSMKDSTMHCVLTMREKSNIKQKLIYNMDLAGRMFTGIVKEVKENRVKVWINQIDKDYDDSTTKEFVFSTTYASKEKSGFYCMPEKEDEIRVYLPTALERDAFVSSAVNKEPLEKPEHKSWKTPGGKEILLTDEGICIVCEKDNIFINLKQNDGIEISSSKPITIKSKKDIKLDAGGSIQVEAGKEVKMAVNKAAVKINQASIVLGAKGIYIN